MFGDARRLQTALNLVRLLATYNMVVLYGAALFMNAFHTNEPGTGERLSLLVRVLIATSLPVFAGFFWRHHFGPLGSLKVPAAQAIRDGLHFILLAVVLEFARISMAYLSPTAGFTWHALHFIALAMLVQTLVSAFFKRWAVGATVALTLLSAATTTFWRVDLLPVPALSFASLNILACVWFALLAGATFWFISFVRRNLSGSVARKIDDQTLTVAALGLLLLASFSYSGFISKPRALISLFTLPVAMWLPVRGDNFWPFFVFYPFFAFGLALRALVLNMRARQIHWVLLSISVVSLLALRGSFESWLRDPIAVLPDISHDIHFDVILAAACIFYLLLFAASAFARDSLRPRLDALLARVPNSFALYVLTPFVYVTAREILRPASWSSGQILLAVNALYIVTVLTSDRLLAALKWASKK